MTLHINKDIFRGIQLAERELKCCQLADDTTIFLNNEKEVKKAIDCLDAFSMVSGLKVNINKCNLFALKDKPNDLTEIDGIGIRDVISYLGIKICRNQKRVDLNFDPLIENIKKKYDVVIKRFINQWTNFVIEK